MRGVTVGVDIGGTRARVGLVRSGRLLAREEFPTRRAGDATGLLHGVLDTARRLLDGAGVPPGDVKGVGLAVPGIIRLADGVVLRAPNCPVLDGAPLAALAADILPWPAAVLNDADGAAWAEHRLGRHGFPGLVYMTVSTGIGGGIISGGRLLAGAETTAAEIGHMVVAADGPRCACGATGCLEALASGTAVSAAYRRQTGRRRNSEAVYALAASGDRAAAGVVDGAAAALASGIAGLWRLLGLPVVIGGGVTLAGAPFWDPLLRRIARLRGRPDFGHLRVVPAALPEDRGLIGAALLAGGSLVRGSAIGYPSGGTESCGGAERR